MKYIIIIIYEVPTPLSGGPWVGGSAVAGNGWRRVVLAKRGWRGGGA